MKSFLNRKEYGNSRDAERLFEGRAVREIGTEEGNISARGFSSNLSAV